MGATNDDDRTRLSLDDALTSIANADEHLRCAVLKAVQWARTDYESEFIQEVISARKELEGAKKAIVGVHPNGRRVE